MPATRSTPKGPWTHRFLVHLCTVILTVLLYWLLGFIVDDIGSWPGPQYDELERARLDQTLLAASRELESQIGDIERRIRDERERQQILADSTASSQKTMDQLLEIHRLDLQKEVTPTAEEQKSLADSEQLFLSNQQQYQRLNDQIAEHNEQLQQLRERERKLQGELDERRKVVHEEYEELFSRHEMKMAALKLAALAPILLVAFVLFLKGRGGTYAPLVYALGVAVALKIALVMHEYFPSRYFKYVLILVCLAVVLRILVSLLRMLAFPKRDWLLKQYREAYEAFLCPVCDYPIRRGPLKYLFWTRRTIRKRPIPQLSAPPAEEPYTCPMCRTRLFEECPSCHAIRHSLLPACEKCGAEKLPEDG